MFWRRKIIKALSSVLQLGVTINARPCKLYLAMYNISRDLDYDAKRASFADQCLRSPAPTVIRIA
ncbi:hypothetical protein BDR06DRAFT_737695 [Suillus hirtellus]|nr:hypothetical protein BDR06DRAFT_737695 [Suillus hirtellus]